MITNDDTTVVHTDEEGYLVDPEDWDKTIAEDLAHTEGLTLTDDHWRIIHFVRDYYEKNRVAPDSRFVIKYLADHLGKGRSARTYLFELFPYGYVKQTCKIAGMRRPRSWSTG